MTDDKCILFLHKTELGPWVSGGKGSYLAARDSLGTGGLMVMKVSDVARFFLANQDEEAGELITHLKLQKLCYYAQGFHLALNGTPLFSEPVEAWQHGPVVRSMYEQYKRYGSQPIEKPEDFDLSIYDEDAVELLNEVHEVYGQYSAWKLRSLTHEEPPWRVGYDTGKSITHSSMKEYFKGLLN